MGKMIGFMADDSIIGKFELIKQFYRRKSSDMLRVLIEDEHEKILSKNTLTGVNCQDETEGGNSSR